MTELLVVMVILGTILGGLTTAFVSGTHAELSANRRVQAQLQATAAFDRLRRDVHCASSASVSGTTMTLNGCASGSVSWCAVGSGTRYALYRQPGTTCSSSGKLYADYLTSPTGTPDPQCAPTSPLKPLFWATAQVAGTSLAKVCVDVRVSVHPTQALDTFELQDDIVLRNSTRT
jgi:type II secretory pathway pseudopilin PulG